jgi:hypothetical protein
MTTPGAVLGTPAYMSPEQARSQPIDHRTDLFSLGVVLYQMATGQRPFSGESAFDIMAAVVSHDPPLTQTIVPELPAKFGQLIHQLLAKNPTERPASAEAVAEALEAIERELSAYPTRVVLLPALSGEPNPWANIESTRLENDPESEPQVLASQTIDSKSDESRVDAKVDDKVDDSLPKTRKPREARASRKQPQKSRLVLWLCAVSGLVALVAVVGIVVKFAKPKDESIVQKDTSKDVPPTKDNPKKDKGVKPKDPNEKQPFTPGPEYKAAELLIHYADLKVKRTSGDEVVAERGKPLPREEFVVTEIDFLEQSVPRQAVERVFLPSIKEMKSLGSIKAQVWALKLTEEEFLELAKWPLAKTLYCLELGVELTPGVFDELKKFPKLSSFVCSAATVDDKLLERLPELSLKKTIGLEYLGRSEKVTDRGLTVLAKLPVERVSLAGAPTAPAFIRLIREHSKASEVNFWGTNVTNDDLKILAECTRLEHIELGDTKITDAGLKHLEGMRQLLYLGLRDTAVTETGAKELAKKLPRCRISGPGGVIEPRP